LTAFQKDDDMTGNHNVLLGKLWWDLFQLVQLCFIDPAIDFTLDSTIE
jgi:hypothetical protein